MTAPDVCDDAAFPAVPESMAGVRAYVRGAVARYGTDVTEVAALLASEIATNSIVHSRSGGIGGRIAVAVIDGDRTVRVQVRDEGSEESVPLPRAPGQPLREHGHGLVLVANLAARWGSEPTEDGGRLTWFELHTDGSADGA
ncbi:MAG TPA: ATP-binding protein [Streptosporangiaceae bacterium]